MTKGLIFDIQHFCVDDGPGIRTTVFFKGCPLRCPWCHNAEGLLGQKQIMLSATSCVLCGICVSACPNGAHVCENGAHRVDRSKCKACGKCAELCPNDALRLAGRTVTVDQVMEEVMRQKPFFDTSGGGLTLSGGEPLMQGRFAIELAQRAKENGMHVCVETCGYCEGETVKEISPSVDIFLYDFKHYLPKEHKRLTGVDHRLILDNLELLNRLNKPVILRCPIIPDCNDNENHALAVAELANRMDNVIEIHIEPYHPFGVEKYTALGMKPAYELREMMSSARSEWMANQIRRHTAKSLIVT